jgi:hypothetical protein
MAGEVEEEHASRMSEMAFQKLIDVPGAISMVPQGGVLRDTMHLCTRCKGLVLITSHAITCKSVVHSACNGKCWGPLAIAL